MDIGSTKHLGASISYLLYLELSAPPTPMGRQLGRVPISLTTGGWLCFIINLFDQDLDPVNFTSTCPGGTARIQNADCTTFQYKFGIGTRRNSGQGIFLAWQDLEPVLIAANKFNNIDGGTGGHLAQPSSSSYRKKNACSCMHIGSTSRRWVLPSLAVKPVLR